MQEVLNKITLVVTNEQVILFDLSESYEPVHEIINDGLSNVLDYKGLEFHIVLDKSMGNYLQCWITDDYGKELTYCFPNILVMDQWTKQIDNTNGARPKSAIKRSKVMQGTKV